MNSERLIINNTDQSTVAESGTTTYAGATVVKAPRGPRRPIKISKKETKKLRDIFGESSKDYPQLFEPETLIKEYDTYISAPYMTGENGTKIPFAIIGEKHVYTGANSIEYTDAIEEAIVNHNEADLAWSDFFGTDSGVSCKLTATGSVQETTEDSKTIVFAADAIQAGTVITVDDQQQTIYSVDSSSSKIYSGTSESDKKEFGSIVNGVATITGYEITTGGDRYFNTSLRMNNIKAATATAASTQTVAQTNAYAIIIPRYPAADSSLAVSFKQYDASVGYDPAEKDQRNKLTLTVLDASPLSTSSATFTGSLDSTAIENGQALGFDESNTAYTEQNLVAVVAFKTLDALSEGTVAYESVAMENKGRVNLTTETWAAYQENSFEIDANLFYKSSVATLSGSVLGGDFFTMYDDFPQSRLIFSYTPGLTSITSFCPVAATKPLDQARYWNVCNEGKVLLKDGTYTFSPMTGARTLMQCRIDEYSYGGKAPMMLNNTGNDIGGQYNSIIHIKGLKYTINPKTQSLLDKYGYNPFVNDRNYGLMLMGQRTCKSGLISDWSYIGHVSSFLQFEEEVKNQIMVPQIGLPNNPYYRELRKEQVQAKINQRCQGNDRIWAEGIVDTSTAPGVNDEQAIANRRFVINVKVKVYVYSEYIVLNFTNVGQDVEVTTA